MYFYGVCHNPTRSNCTILPENVTRITIGNERYRVEPCNFSILSLQANFPSAPHKLCSLQSGQYEKGGTQYLVDNTPPYPKKSKLANAQPWHFTACQKTSSSGHFFRDRASLCQLRHVTHPKLAYFLLKHMLFCPIMTFCFILSLKQYLRYHPYTL